MIGIVICTHSTFAQGLQEACEMIAGKQENFQSVCFTGEQSLVELGEQLKTIGAQYPDGCVYVVDLVNATPFNACLYAIAQTGNVVLTGASLPMMLELLTKRAGSRISCSQLAEEIQQSSSCYVTWKCSEDVFHE